MPRNPRRDRLEFLPFWIALKALGWLTPRTAQAAGAALGWLAWLILGRRRRVAVDNLARVYGSRLSPGRRRLVAARSFASLGRLVGDFSQIPKVDRAWVERWIRYEGWESYLAARARGKGVLYLAAHFGSWEMIPIAQAALGEPMCFIVRPADNDRIERVIRGYRERLGNVAIAKRDALKECLRRLKSGETVGILIDQHVPPDRGVATTFLGQPTYTVSALASLALRTGAPVLPVSIRREPGGRQRIVIEPPVPPAATGDRALDVIETTRRYNQVVERWIEESPESWLWSHRRFRER